MRSRRKVLMLSAGVNFTVYATVVRWRLRGLPTVSAPEFGWPSLTQCKPFGGRGGAAAPPQRGERSTWGRQRDRLKKQDTWAAVGPRD
jgi:hypothetical protein